jgi:hypothetical protein
VHDGVAGCASWYGDRCCLGSSRVKAASTARPRDLTPQHRHLVPEDQDLGVLIGVTARQQHQLAEHPAMNR